MKKSIYCLLSLVLCFSLLLCGCGKDSNPTLEVKSDYETIEDPEPEVVEPEFAVNPLTGEENLDPSKVSTKPIAIMVNNITTAQRVQTGIGSADIVYETYAEGGITRLMAVFKDVSKAPKLGTIRSARISYVELAQGHDALYFHAGWDPTYCAPYIKNNNIPHFDLNSGKTANYGWREKNGLSSEHTLYTSGEKLAEGINALGYSTTTTRTENWQNFVSADSAFTPGAGVANIVNVPMSSSNPTKFVYDTSTGKYTRNIKSGVQTDYVTGNTIQFKNILVLFTTVTTLSDGKHVKEGMSGGTGYYATNGGYMPINWQKGGPTDSLKITAADGTAVQYNVGNSWVFFANNNITSSVTFS